MVPTFLQIQNSRTLQGLLNIFQGTFLCMLKKWYADYKKKAAARKTTNLGFLLFLSNFRPSISVKFQYWGKYENQTTLFIHIICILTFY